MSLLCISAHNHVALSGEDVLVTTLTSMCHFFSADVKDITHIAFKELLSHRSLMHREPRNEYSDYVETIRDII